MEIVTRGNVLIDFVDLVRVVIGRKLVNDSLERVNNRAIDLSGFDVVSIANHDAGFGRVNGHGQLFNVSHLKGIGGTFAFKVQLHKRISFSHTSQ